MTANIASPGSLTHVVTASDADGLDSIVVHVVSEDSLLVADTVEIPFDTHLSSTQYTWTIPAGMLVGTNITISAEAWDLADYSGADTLIVPVQTGGQAAAPRARPAKP